MRLLQSREGREWPVADGRLLGSSPALTPWAMCCSHVLPLILGLSGLWLGCLFSPRMCVSSASTTRAIGTSWPLKPCHLDVSARADTVVCHKLGPLWGEDQVWENLIEQLFKAFNRESAVVTGPRGRGGGSMCPSSPQAPSSSARMLPGRFTSPGILGPWVLDFSSSPSLIQGTWDLITHPVQGSETFLFRFPRGREVSQAFLLQKLVSGKGLPGRSSGPAPWAAPSAPRDCQRLVGTWHFWGTPLPARNLQWCKVMPQMPKPAVETWLCWCLFCF